MFKRRNISVSADEAVTPKGFDDFELRIGDELRGERATRGLNLADVEAAIKIKARYLEAIENAELEVFDAMSFVPGYVRSYAKFLNLDADDVFRRFCHESGFELAKGISSERKARTEPLSTKQTAKDPLLNSRTPFVPQSESFMDRLQPGAIGSILVLMAVLGGVGYGAWYALKEVQRVQLAPVEQAPEIAQLDPVEQLSPPDVLDDDASVSRSVPFERVYRPDALDLPVVESRDAPIARLNPNEIGTLVAPEAQPVVVAEAVEEQPLPIPQVSEERPQQVALMVTRPAWVRVETADGTRIFEKNMEVGEEYVLPATEAAPMLRAGMAGFVYFRVGDDVYGPVGSGAQIVSDVSIAKTDVLEQFAKADPSANSELARAVALADASGR